MALGLAALALAPQAQGQQGAARRPPTPQEIAEKADPLSDANVEATFLRLAKRAKPAAYRGAWGQGGVAPRALESFDVVSYTTRRITRDSYLKDAPMKDLPPAGPPLHKRAFDPVGGAAVPNSAKYPFGATCRVMSIFANGDVGLGTGVMVSDHHMLTAAHVLYSHDLGYAKSVVVAPGYDGRAKRPLPFGVAAARYSTTCATYAATGRETEDYAVVSLNKPIGNKSGWLNFGHITPIEGVEAATSCYPDFRSGGDGANQQWYFQGPVQVATDEYVITRFMSGPGASGSGLYARADGARKVFAIQVVGGQNGLGFVRINPYRENVLRNFMRRF